MKKASALVAAAAGLFFGLVSMSSQAGTATGNFNVSINFTSACTVNTAGVAPTFTYTSNQVTAAAVAGVLTYQVNCTNGVPYTMALDTAGVGWTWAAGTYTNTASTLQYTLTVPAAIVATGLLQTYTLGGSMAANQAGKCTTLGGCTYTDAHVLTVTF
jgi:spore coat protein U-like protein